MRITKITKNPFLLFSPFLVLYILLVFILPTHGTTGDENRYIMYAQNLNNGFYSLPGNDIGDGPGYSILLMPFMALGLPLICIALVNALLYYLSVILLFKSLQHVVSFQLALLGSLFWGCYYNSYENIPLVLPEIFSAFLISLLIFNLLMAFRPVNSKKTKKYIYFSGFIIGYIALTKVIFGYVLAFMLIGSGLLWIINRKDADYRTVVIIFLIALTTTIPYLIFTYRVTGKTLYWGTSGGENLYWMSTPYEGEYGNWFHPPVNGIIPDAEYIITLNHRADFEEILKYKGAERDDVFKKLAIENIRSHPVKFVKNCVTNIGRLLFNYPYSYKFQKPATLLRILPNGILVVFMIFCLVPTLINWRKIIFPGRFLLFFALLYLGGTTLASAETRMFTVIVPVLLFWVALIIQKSIKLSMTWENVDLK